MKSRSINASIRREEDAVLEDPSGHENMRQSEGYNVIVQNYQDLVYVYENSVYVDKLQEDKGNP